MEKLNKKIISKFMKLNIGIIYLFGSLHFGIEREDSDIDIGIIFLDKMYKRIIGKS